ncbi:MAG: hypothetical protein LBT67_03165 [Holosporaceae bacterium]|jgi:hypothetical protein|nr:hypothetical protein [Holosporaceae bacterium]
MFKLLIIAASLLLSMDLQAVSIYTPAHTENNKFAIKCPDEWGYRTLKGDNGLIGVMWPAISTFNLTGTAVFIFVQDNRGKLPKAPCNINIFREKCPGADFKFSSAADNKNYTKSIGEKYFKGHCGRTAVIFEEKVGQYILVFFFISDKYVTKKQFAEVKIAVNAYRREVEKYIMDNPELHKSQPPLNGAQPSSPPEEAVANSDDSDSNGATTGNANATANNDDNGDNGDDDSDDNSDKKKKKKKDNKTKEETEENNPDNKTEDDKTEDD